MVSAPVCSPFLFRAGVRGCGQLEGQGLNLSDVQESCGGMVNVWHTQPPGRKQKAPWHVNTWARKTQLLPRLGRRMVLGPPKARGY